MQRQFVAHTQNINWIACFNRWDSSEKMKHFGFHTSAIKWLKALALKQKKFGLYWCFFWLWNIKVWCSKRLQSWNAPSSITSEWSYLIVIRRWLLFVCRCHLYFLSTYIFEIKSFCHQPLVQRPQAISSFWRRQN